jgi:3'5'-cyclic nucleotide phosphodiesterase
MTMSTVKLMSRIVSPQSMKYRQSVTDIVLESDVDSTKFCENGIIGKDFHDHTYGITSDPLTHFSAVFASLIHDVDHRGIPNSQHIHEHTHLASHYQNRSIAEQHSVDVAWALLMEDRFKSFRRTIYSTVSGFARFRKLVVNCVMATDIVDKDLKATRNARWDRVFQEGPVACACSNALFVNRKATLVLEHLMQASDVAHTMQHWHVYRKWNERLFVEMRKAFKDGRQGFSGVDPSETWYQSEKDFFDFYIIPLTKKLKDCGVFGVSGDEYYNYAIQNRRQWDIWGKQLVSEMLEREKRCPTMGDDPMKQAVTRSPRSSSIRKNSTSHHSDALPTQVEDFLNGFDSFNAEVGSCWSEDSLVDQI